MSALAGGMPRAGARIALFGRETFYVGGLYARQAAIFSVLALAIVLSLDAANNFARIMMGEVSAAAPEGPGRLLLYMLLRGGYVLPSVLPITAMVGVVWAEFILAVSRERFMIANSGRSPTRSLIPAAVFGLVVGALQFVAIAYGRPAAVDLQGSLDFRYYGPRYAQPLTTQPLWMASGQAVVNAQIEFAAGAVALRNVLAYNFDARGRLEAVISAERAEPGPGPGVWTFTQGSLWDVARIAAGGGGPTSMESADFANLRRALALDPTWVRNNDVLPPLLPQGDLAVLASGGPGIPNASEYQAAFHERFAGILLCAGMALLGASLSLLNFAPGMGPMPALLIGIAGGLAYVSSNAVSMLGTYGSIPPMAAAWGVPLALTLIAFGLIWRRHRRVRVRLAEAFSRR